MLFRVSCQCGRVFVVGEGELGTLMTCPVCQRTITIPQKLEPAADEADSDRDEKRYWQQAGSLGADPSSPEEQEYRRRYSPAAKAKRAAARRPSRVRLVGMAWLAAGVVLIPPAFWLASLMKVPNLPGIRRVPGVPLLAPLVCVCKGVVEVVTGVQFMEMVKRGDDPRAGWREFGAWLTLIALLIVAVAGTFGLSVALKELLGLPDIK
jgi:hypothetical protein